MPTDPPEIRLFTFPGSHAGLTTELLLAHADVPHEHVQLRPGLHAASLKLRGFPAPTVPALQIGDRKVNGTRTISRIVAEELAPDAGLLPTQAEDRERVLEAERDGERLQKAVRRLFYAAAAGSRDGVRTLVDANYGVVPRPVRELVVRALVPAANLGHGVRPERGPDYARRIVELLERADELVDAGVLGGARPNVADFQFAPNVIVLSELPGALGRYVRQRRVFAPMRELLPTFPVTFDVRFTDAWLAGTPAARVD